MQKTGLTANEEVMSLQHTVKQMATSQSPTDSTVGMCPANMVYIDCADICEESCEDSLYGGCTLSACDSSMMTCACAPGFFRKGSECVTFDECGCYYEGEYVKIGDVRLNDNCSQLCHCSANSELTCRTHICGYGAECITQDGVRQCYCTTSIGFHGDGSQCSEVYDCSDIYNAGYTDSGVYTISSIAFTEAGHSHRHVYCDMSDDQGWTVIQRRLDGAVDFNRNWTSFKEGFGDLDHEFWYGNEGLYILTNHKNYELRIDLSTEQGIHTNITYDIFRIADESYNYKLVYIGSYAGNADADVLSNAINSEFSTYDRDNDEHISLNCAADETLGAWWYTYCDTAGVLYGLNSKYSGVHPSETSEGKGITINNVIFSFVEMKVHPAELTAVNPLATK